MAAKAGRKSGKAKKRPHNNLIARALQKQVFYAVKVTLLPSKRPTITE